MQQANVPPSGKTLFERLRMPLTWTVLPLWLAFLGVTKSAGSETPPYEVLEMLGLLLIFAAVLGRLWCSLYISGRKDKELCASGPYSISRNPLYFFSLLGIIGVCLAAKNIVLTIVSAGAFCAYYSAVIAREEKRLADLFGDEFKKYVEQTPRFFPRLERPGTEEKVLVNAKAFLRALTDAAWFLMAIVGIELLEAIQESGYLPVWTLPI